MQQFEVFARDGIRLDGLFYPPIDWDGGACDILLHRTPYDLYRDRTQQQTQFFNKNGYGVVLQNIRGRYKSEGKFIKYDPLGVTDAYDTLQAIADSGFLKSKVGMWGTSYGAHTQAEAALSRSEFLGPLIINQGGSSNMWDHSVRNNGAFEFGRQFTWVWNKLLDEVNDKTQLSVFKDEELYEWLMTFPNRRGISPIKNFPEYEDSFFKEFENSDYTDFWQEPSRNWSEHYSETADVPIMHVGGWYDIFLKGTVENYCALKKILSSEQRLVVGPWIHGGNDKRIAGEVDFGEQAAIKDFWFGFHLDWFDRHFGPSDDVIVENRADLFVMGKGSKDAVNSDGAILHGGEWITSTSFPEIEKETMKLYLSDGYSLVPNQSSKFPCEISFNFDPSNPVPTIGGQVSNRLKDGAFNQREDERFPGSKAPYLPLSLRKDILVFQSEPFAEDVTAVGEVSVVLHTSTDSLDTDFTVKIIDSYPAFDSSIGQYDMNLTDGIVRLSYRNGSYTRKEVVPGEVYRIEFKLFPIANTFRAGHRLRLDISSSNFPRFDINQNTGSLIGKDQSSRIAKNTIYYGAGYDSYVELQFINSLA